MSEQTATMVPAEAEGDAQTTPAPDVSAAQVMIDAFNTVGTEYFNETVLDFDGVKVRYSEGWPARAVIDDLPKTLAVAARRRHNVIIRPEARRTVLIQLDDLKLDALDRVRPVAFLCLETSPGNFQAWIAQPAHEVDDEFVRRLKKGTGADKGASGAVRIAGSLNFKEKYSPNFPRVEIVHCAPGLITSRAQLESLGVVAVPARVAPEAVAVPPPAENDLASVVITTGRARRQGWPSYQRCLDDAPPNGDGTGPDRSSADFTWCLIAIGWSPERGGH
jgi:hypothetical protein